MSPASWTTRFFPLQDRGAATCGVLAPLLTRLALGHAFLLTGWGKLANVERTTGFFESLGLPLPGFHAVFIGCLELVGGAFLIFGLGTRAIAFLLAATMVVALATADRTSLLSAFGLHGHPGFLDVTPFAFLLFLAWLGHAGAGAFSVDGWLRRRASAGDSAASVSGLSGQPLS